MQTSQNCDNTTWNVIAKISVYQFIHYVLRLRRKFMHHETTNSHVLNTYIFFIIKKKQFSIQYKTYLKHNEHLIFFYINGKNPREIQNKKNYLFLLQQ